uniref:Uncharacterized protein n=1 Tax=Timema monikensis TaxID=170555 RepID=A0A7R9EID1_9NEOP|nr:unnamed protein product [Timema monikensis]
MFVFKHIFTVSLMMAVMSVLAFFTLWFISIIVLCGLLQPAAPVSNDAFVIYPLKRTRFFRVFNFSHSRRLLHTPHIKTLKSFAPEGDIISTDTLSDDDEFHDALRPITMEDLVISVNKMKESKVRTGSLFMTPLDMD